MTLYILFGLFSAVMWGGLVYVLVVEPIRVWRRHRRAKPVEPSPLIREIDAWREARDRTFKRQGRTPLGHYRLGVDVDPRHRRR